MRRSSLQTARGRILVVDDHPAARESVSDVLRCAEYEVVGLASAVEALPRLERDSFDVVITDLQMPGMDGLELIRQLQVRRIETQCIMVTAHASIASAVEAMRHGAFDYLEKPFNVEKLERLVDRAMACRRLRGEDRRDASSDNAVDDGSQDVTAGMVGESPVMQAFRQRLLQAAPTEETVLICGESGTGK
ncbi:MAG: sigma-54-dependent Fis family transcriptional regulator, partial [Planctomycetales bacterium]|nr:sigma-54-dependent Fis family transcriptional regulator [Planctomycetales bacterium]